MGAPVNHKRLKPRLRSQPAFIAWVVEQGCTVCGAPAEFHHVRTGQRGRDDSWGVALCPRHHRHGPEAFHTLGSNARFQEAHGICLVTVAEWNREQGLAKGLIRADR